MAKTQEELNALKKEVETVSRKLHELTEEELAQISGGNDSSYYYNRMLEIMYDGNLTINEKEALLHKLKSEVGSDPDLSNGMKYEVIDTIVSLMGGGR